jgi:hypothetical protein
MQTLRPILLLEVNEVHWRIVDRALERARMPALRSIVDGALTRTTHVEDRSTLSPWITWPTLHRGVSAAEHGIRNLGQDVSTFRGRAIWEDVRAAGGSIGICGSLQSWPPMDPGPGGFYVPDTFARDARCVPSFVSPLQRLNLGLVRESGRIRSPRVPFADALRALPAAVRASISARFLARAAFQLAAERRRPDRVALRPTFQTLLFWDVFKRLFDARRPPALSTFFTNHVASVLHRRWDELFPEDFPDRTTAPDPARALPFALDVLDEVLSDALALQRACPELVLVLASSMGQSAVHRDHHDGRELVLRDLARLLQRLGIAPTAFTVSLAMVPQTSATVPESAARGAIVNALRACRSASGLRVFQVDARGTSVTITLGTPPSADVDAGTLTLASGARVAWSEVGIGVTRTAAGTGNHVPEGSLMVLGRGIDRDGARASMASTDVKPFLLALAGVRGGGA